MGKYILDMGENDSKEVLGIYNLPLAHDVWDAMAQMSAMVGDKAHGKNAIKTPIEHIIFRPRKGEILTREQFDQMKTETIKRLGYQDCPRVEWEDILNGEPHQHVAVLRIDMGGRLIKPYLPVRTCIQIAQGFEKKFGLKPSMANSPKAPYHDAQRKIAELWRQTEGQVGPEVKATFEQNGFILARGDRGQFILMKSGKPYNPTRVFELKEQGVKEAGVKRRFKGVDINTLPSVKEIQAGCGLTPRQKQQKQRTYKTRKRTGKNGKTFGSAPQRTRHQTVQIPTLLPTGTAWQSIAMQDRKDQPRKPFSVSDQKGWPVEAVIDWETWGKKNPSRFFNLWSRLRPDLFAPI